MRQGKGKCYVYGVERWGDTDAGKEVFDEFCKDYSAIMEPIDRRPKLER